MTDAKPKKAKAEEIAVNEKKWGKQTIAVGWTLVPNMLLERQAVLGINSTQLNVLLVILKHWWEQETLPFPEMNTIAKMIGLSRSTVQRNIRELEGAGFIKRIVRKKRNGGNNSNQYDFTGLIELLKPFATEELKQREEQKQEKQNRLTIKGNRPALKVVKS
ncbi:helix-turn-helix domain-containing protein [Cellvibrio sp. QJXJ]|uniref:helix-turn-helix domain-containing protein n=1 Tax=Cellvibrio sp. QJXJ TaxID=2964606 RepID=UPI0021C38AD1|nr:helix-turn-helix domain-containing protein [Cellvibrio sp. QJXJ]UUA75280.1 helix-turn-helix domain-containing protein [Cellvibrio sp. QJXJ]